jgi:hypothetical protein
MDVGLTEACNLALCALVGRLAYKEKCKQSMDAWISTHWMPILGYTPKIHLLQQGWLAFIFRNTEDSTLILDSFWPIDGGSLMLKRWRLGFNPTTEFFPHRHVWVLLPGLPLQLWNQQALKLIGASLGRFLCVDQNSLDASDRRMARIYVELDIQAGLPEIIEIDWRNQLITQRLDYLGIPFRCSLCRRTGHLRRDCHKFPQPDIVLEPEEETNFDGYISSPSHFVEEEAPISRETISSDDSLVGKIQLLCPSLYNSLSSWDRLYITEQGNNILCSETLVAPPNLPTLSPYLPQTEPVPTVSHSIPRPSSTTHLPLSDPPTGVSATHPTTDITDTPQTCSLPGYTESTQSEFQLETMYPTASSSHSLPFDSIPLPTYLGNTIYHPTLPSADHPSSSNMPLPPGPDPHWSRGIGLELSPLKTRSARKKSQTGPKTSGSTTNVTNQGALRGLKALARGNT